MKAVHQLVEANVESSHAGRAAGRGRGGRGGQHPMAVQPGDARRFAMGGKALRCEVATGVVVVVVVVVDYTWKFDEVWCDENCEHDFCDHVLPVVKSQSATLVASDVASARMMENMK